MEGGGVNHPAYQVLPAPILLLAGGGKGDKAYTCDISISPVFRHYNYSVLVEEETEAC